VFAGAAAVVRGVVSDTPIVLSLCDRTGVLVEPWLEAGYECWIVDVQHAPGITREGRLVRAGADIRTWLPPRLEYVIGFAQPPCTDQAVSGARWFVDKGLAGLAGAIALVERSRDILAWTDAPWMLENPVGTIASYWRKPDATFQPWHYGDLESKKTCLWFGGGFVMPPYEFTLKPHDVRESCWKMGPSPDRGDKRSVTPRRFARAVFEVNEPLVRGRAA